jgi:hypothetical protein
MSNSNSNSVRKNKLTISQRVGAIKISYNTGFSSGWCDYDHVGKIVGTTTAAKVGYSKGFKAHKKSFKALECANKYSGK